MIGLPTPEEYREVLLSARRSDDQILSAVRVGSHVYGTAGPTSDRDYMLVLKEPTDFGDLVIRKGLNITVRGRKAFNSAVKEGNVFALECVYTPRIHILKGTDAPLRVREQDRKQICFSALERADSDFSKGVKTSNPKRVYHAFRVLEFAKQLIEQGEILDFSAAKQIYENVMTEPRPLEEAFGNLFKDTRWLLRSKY